MTLCSTALGHQMHLLGGCLTVNCLLKLTLCSTHLDHQMPLLEGYIWLSTAFAINCIPQDVKMTLCSTALGHQMQLLGGMSDCELSSQLHSAEYQVDCTYTHLDHQMTLLEGYVSSEILSSFRVWVLLHRGLFYERSIKWSLWHCLMGFWFIPVTDLSGWGRSTGVVPIQSAKNPWGAKTCESCTVWVGGPGPTGLPLDPLVYALCARY